MKKRKLLALVACSPLLLTGCSNEKRDAIDSIEKNVIAVVQNDDSNEVFYSFVSPSCFSQKAFESGVSSVAALHTSFRSTFP